MFPDPTMKGAMRNSRRMLQKTIDSDRLPTKRIALCGDSAPLRCEKREEASSARLIGKGGDD